MRDIINGQQKRQWTRLFHICRYLMFRDITPNKYDQMEQNHGKLPSHCGCIGFSGKATNIAVLDSLYKCLQS